MPQPMHYPAIDPLAMTQRYNFVLNIIGLRMLLDLAYVYAVSPLFTYAGFVLSPGSGKIAASYVLTVLLGALVPPRTMRPSDLLLLLLFVFVMLPCMSLWALQDLPSYHMVLLSGGYAACVAATYLRLPTVPLLRFGPPLFYVVCLALSATVFLMLWRRGAIANLNFNLRTVYEYRQDILDNILYGALGYMVPWYGKLVGPTLLVIAMYSRAWIAVAIVFASELLLFGLTSNKEYVLYPFVLIGIFFISGTVERLSFRFVTVSAAVLIATILAYTLTDFSTLTSIIAHRSFFVVAFNHFEYFEFFNDAPHVALSNSVLSSFSEYPFDAPIPAVIGYGRYQAGLEGFSNTGVLASGYMHFGPWGVMFYGFYAGLIFRIFDSLVLDRIPLRLGLMLSCIPGLQFVNTDLSIALLTGGILLGFVLLLLFGRPNASEARNQMRSADLLGAHSD